MKQQKATAGSDAPLLETSKAQRWMRLNFFQIWFWKSLEHREVCKTQIRPIESLRPQHTVSDKMTPCGSLWLYNGSLSASYLGINDDERQQLLIETLFLIDSAHKD